MHTETWALALAGVFGSACGFLNTAASSGSAVSMPTLLAIGLDPVTGNATNRPPVLIGAMSATGSFHRKRAIPWRNAPAVAVPVTVGAGVGAVLAELIPSRHVGLVITAAVMSVTAIAGGLRPSSRCRRRHGPGSSGCWSW